MKKGRLEKLYDKDDLQSNLVLNLGITPVGDMKKFNMERYEMSINILDKEYVDSLIICLVRQGYTIGDMKRFNMERYEMSINILDKEYVDSLIVCLVRQGYAVYYNKDKNVVCFTVNDDELIKIKKV
jgi:hypothetical protein